MDLEKYSKLKKRAEEAKRERDRAEGALEQIDKRLKEEFDCDSLEEAQELLEKLEREQKKANALADRALSDFESKWRDKI